MKGKNWASVDWLKNNRQKWILVLFFTLFVPFFLLVFQPFGVNNYDPSHSIGSEFLLGTIIFGAVIGLTLVFFEFLVAPLVFKNHSKGVFLLRIFLEMLAVGSVIYFTYNAMGNFHDWGWSSYFGFLRDVFLLSILPLVLLFLYFNYRDTKNENRELRFTVEAVEKSNELVMLAPISGKETLALMASKICYVEADENYVSIHYLENGQLKKSLLRSTMKHMGAQLGHSPIVRCHRSYYVNTTLIEKVIVNVHQLKLYLKSVNEPIPVSRPYVKYIRSILGIQPK